MSSPYKKVTLKTLSTLESEGWIPEQVFGFPAVQWKKGDDFINSLQEKKLGTQIEGDEVYQYPESAFASVDEEHAVSVETSMALTNGSLNVTVYANGGIHYTYKGARLYISPAQAVEFKAFLNSL